MTITSDKPFGRWFYSVGCLDDLCEHATQADIDRHIQTVMREDFFTPTELQNHFDRSLETLRRKEEQCDIKVSDFILDHYQHTLLFYNPQHPTDFVLNHALQEILKHMGEPPQCCLHLLHQPLKDWYLPILPSVRSYLQIQYEEDHVETASTVHYPEIKSTEQFLRQSILDLYFNTE